MASPASPKADIPKNVEPDSTPSQPFPPPKTDKPRPHVCTTCTRSFARLEHLKRHERSHTKEKPFECDQCGRCFARRDLLLRHQQKLHQTGNPSKPRTARRESTSGVPPSRARKSSIAGAAPFTPNQMSRASMRPRANTISHIDANMLMSQQHANRQQQLPPFMHQPISPMPNFSGFDFNPIGFGHMHATHHVPKIETSGLGLDIEGGLKTAPLARFTEDNRLFSTVNPAQLHFGGHTGTPESPFTQSFPPFVPNGQTGETHVDWMNSGNDAMMSGVQDSVVDGSSPSAISTGSQSGFSEVMIDGSNQPMHTTDPWDSSMLLTSSHFSTDTIPVFSDLMQQNPSMVHGDLHDPNAQQFLSFTTGTNSSMNTMASATPFPGQFLSSPLEFSSDDVSFRSPFVGGNGQPSSMTNVSTFGITDSVRQALLFSLSRPTQFGHTSRYSQSGMTASVSGASHSESISVSLPSTSDLQRFVNSYLQFFHPHVPFIHIPTLNFDSPVFTNHSRSHNSSSGCLILAMAAIGASFEFEHTVAQELSEACHTLIAVYLEERRTSMPIMNGNKTHTQETPLWLVQAMLLNLIYRHQCGNQKFTEIAATQSAALVSLAKSASLDKSDLDLTMEQKAFEVWSRHNHSVDGEGTPTNPWDESMSLERATFSQWYRWKSSEERKRTLFSVFIMSTFHVIGTHAQPLVLNSELHLELPCEEDLWSAKSPVAWNRLGGIKAIQHSAISFTGALAFLLSANKRQTLHNSISSGHMSSGSSAPLEQLPKSQLSPSTFGCFILIHALHVSIWEFYQRHQDREWNSQATQQLFALMAPALQEWQSAWASNPNHHLERSHHFGPLAADSIPLLDLAYMRLCVNIGRSKEAFWSPNFEGMVEEFSSSRAASHQAEFSSSRVASHQAEIDQPKLADDLDHMHLSENMMAKSDDVPNFAQISKQARDLRRAACYAADSLRMADKLGLTFAEFTSRDLPIQNAISTFDCALVLSDWMATIQDRVGPYFGIIGTENSDLHASSAASILLDEDDHRLIAQIAEIISNAETKIEAARFNQEAMELQGIGYAARLLMVMALMLDRAAVWGITGVMANCLRTLANVMDDRANRSLSNGMSS